MVDELVTRCSCGSQQLKILFNDSFERFVTGWDNFAPRLRFTYKKPGMVVFKCFDCSREFVNFYGFNNFIEYSRFNISIMNYFTHNRGDTWLFVSSNNGVTAKDIKEKGLKFKGGDWQRFCRIDKSVSPYVYHPNFGLDPEDFLTDIHDYNFNCYF